MKHLTHQKRAAALAGDQYGDGIDTRGVVRRDPPTQDPGADEVSQTWDASSTGSADAPFAFGKCTFAPDLPLETNPRLTIEVP